MQAGAAYVFDQYFYQHFQPIAIHEGLDISEIDFENTEKLENDFLIIRLNI
ncbi:MAG: hypothetical protein GWP19_14640 [Planctomycetia bacterium]|nr:hypothetical protein [Planctomycetia bacterium]